MMLDLGFVLEVQGLTIGSQGLCSSVAELGVGVGLSLLSYGLVNITGCKISYVPTINFLVLIFLACEVVIGCSVAQCHFVYIHYIYIRDIHNPKHVVPLLKLMG